MIVSQTPRNKSNRAPLVSPSKVVQLERILKLKHLSSDEKKRIQQLLLTGKREKSAEP